MVRMAPSLGDTSIGGRADTVSREKDPGLVVDQFLPGKCAPCFLRLS